MRVYCILLSFHPDLHKLFLRRWSFGVLLWEIETGGELCYLAVLRDLCSGQGLYTDLENHLKLISPPENCNIGTTAFPR